MNQCKRCIFHIPNHIDENGSSGSQVRPRKMLHAFEEIGYQVDAVMGYGEERKREIQKIKKNIKSGIRYDFLYSESSTMPTLLTEKDHIPRYPFLDFNFFKFCKKSGIKIGLFYRDIYWKFPAYKDAVKGIKLLVAEAAYRYDLRKYAGLLDAFYVPNKKVGRYIDDKKLHSIMKELPPGSSYDTKLVDCKKEYYRGKDINPPDTLHIFYVGGIGNQYSFEELMKAVNSLDGVKLTICCRVGDWEKNKSQLEQYVTSQIDIVHKTGEELAEYYQKADICACYFRQHEYMEMAVPIKLFEYLSYGIPVLASSGNPAGEFVAQNHIGWTIDYNKEEAKKLITKLKNDYGEIVRAHENCLTTLQANRWCERARQVCQDLK